jgi:hypothetical protein
VGPPELVLGLGRRAPSLPRGRDRDGHVVHVEVPRAGPRRRDRARPDLGQRVDGEPGRSPTPSGSTRPARSRPTSRSPSSTTSASGGRHRHRAPPRRDAGCAGIGDAHAFVTDVTSGTRRSTCRDRARASCCSRSPAPTCRTRRSRSARRARSTSASPACCASGSPTSASSGTSCTCRRAGGARVRPARRGGRGVRPAARRAQGAGQPADGEGLPRLRPRHRQHRRPCSRPGSASRWRLDKPGGFIGRDAVLGAEGGRPAAPRLVQVLVHDPSR